MHAVIGGEEHLPADEIEVSGIGAVRDQRIGDPRRACRGAVALPQLVAVGAVIGLIIKRAVDDSGVAGVISVRRADQRRARGCAVRIIQAVRAGEEEMRGVGLDEVAGIAGLMSVRRRQHHRAGFGAVGRIKLPPAGAVGDVIKVAVLRVETAEARAARSGIHVGHDMRAGRRAVRHPKLTAMHAVIGGEEHLPADEIEIARVRTVGDQRIGDPGRACRGAVALPQLVAIGAVIRLVIERAVDHRGMIAIISVRRADQRRARGRTVRIIQPVRSGEEEMRGVGLDEIARVAGLVPIRRREHHRAGFRAVGRVKLPAAGAVGDVKQFPVLRVEATEAGRTGSRVHVGHDVRARRRSIGHKQLAPVRAVGGGEVVGGEKDFVADLDQILRIGAARIREKVAQQDGAGRGAVGYPHLAAVRAVIGGEDHLAAADRRDLIGVGIPAWVDIGDRVRARARAVGHPQFGAVAAVIAAIEQLRARDDRVFVIRHRGDKAVMCAVERVEALPPSPAILVEHRLRAKLHHRIRIIVGKRRYLGRTRQRPVRGEDRIMAGRVVISEIEEGVVDDEQVVVDRPIVRPVARQLDRASGCAVRGVDLAAVHAVVHREEYLAAGRGERLRVGGVAAYDQVLDHVRAGGRPVGHPQFLAVDAVVGGEERLRARRDELRAEAQRLSMVARRIHVVEQVRAGTRAVADIEFRSRRRAIGRENDRAVAETGDGGWG